MIMGVRVGRSRAGMSSPLRQQVYRHRSSWPACNNTGRCFFESGMFLALPGISTVFQLHGVYLYKYQA
jgi:hypothetical protein